MSRVPLPRWSGRHTRRRRWIQIGLLAVFALLPAVDAFRFDFVHGRLLLAGRSIWLDEWALLWLALMLGMWVIGALSLVLGRVYCAYACPQMVFSELAHDLDELSGRAVRRLAPALGPDRRRRATRTLSFAAVAVLSVGASALFMGYFSPLGDVLARLARLDLGLWVGAVGASTAAIGFLNLAFVREGFCRSACPYGLLQAVLEDGRSLHVAFDESSGPCIDCQACERVCPMEIDIRKGAFQIECTRCGSCVDACDRVLSRLRTPRPGLLSFRLRSGSESVWDVKRVLVGLATAGFGLALVLALVQRETLALTLSPVYADRSAEPGVAVSRFLLRASNRGEVPVSLRVRAEGLPEGTTVAGLEKPEIGPGQEARFTLVVRVPEAAVMTRVTPFTWVLDGGGASRRFPAAFYSGKGGPEPGGTARRS